MSRSRSKTRSTQTVSLLEPLDSRTLLSVVSPTIFNDGFAGKAVNLKNWQLLSPGASDVVVDQTHMSTSDSHLMPPVKGGAAHLTLQTFNPADPGNSFLGTTLVSTQTFSVNPTTGYDITLSFRIPSGTPGGLMAGFFVSTARGADDQVEADWVMDSNELTQPTQHALSVLYNNATPTDPAAPAWVDLPGGKTKGKVSTFHQAEIKIDENHTAFFLDKKLMRTSFTTMIKQPFKLYLMVWAAGPEMKAGYNPALQPTSSASANKTYTVDFNSVVVKKIPATTMGTPYLTVTSSTWDPSVFSGNVYGLNPDYDFAVHVLTYLKINDGWVGISSILIPLVPTHKGPAAQWRAGFGTPPPPSGGTEMLAFLVPDAEISPYLIGVGGGGPLPDSLWKYPMIQVNR